MKRIATRARGPSGLAETARRLLRGAALAATKVRVACLRVALGADGPVTRERFARALPGGRVDRVTLYRTLRTFEEAGLVRRKEVSGGGTVWCIDRCEHGLDRCPGHMHFECRECGRVECVRTAPARVRRAVGTLFARSHLPVEGARVEAYGVCRECRPRGGRGSKAG